ncbi:MAG TPA: hypothetical protein VMM60_14975 [Ilumatobacter sp.]|nr:hypothetical protein [Ilumatobacter sp.]
MDQEQRLAELEAQISTISANRRKTGWRSRWAAVGAAVAVSLGAGSGLYYVSAAPGDVVQNSFVSISPVRILDTRPAPENVGGFVGPLSTGQIHTFAVTGVAGVPANAASVVLNVTATGTTERSFLTVYPTGEPQPVVSNLNWTAGGATVPNLVTVKVGAGGQVSVFNAFGNVHVIADIAGYYVPSNDKFISLDVFEAGSSGTATHSDGFGANTGLTFVDGVNNDANFHLVLPPDYTPGTTLVATFTWHTSAVNCDVHWRANSTSVSRAGQVHPQGVSASAGMSEPGVGAQGATSNMVNSSTFELTSPNAAFTLQPGDSYSFGLFRSGGSAQDTCAASARIDSMVILYE